LIGCGVERLVERRGLAGGTERRRIGPLGGGGAGARRGASRVPERARGAWPRPGARVRRCGDPPETVASMAMGSCYAMSTDSISMRAL
jgi:hypothetical protein